MERLRYWLWGVVEIFYLKRILLWHLRGNLSTDINRNINRILDLLTLASHTDVCWRALFYLSTSSPKNSCVGGYVNPFLFSDRTSRLTTLITFNESQRECIQKNCLLRNQNYLYAFRLKYLVWRKTICRKKKAKLRTLLFDSRNQLSRHALKAPLRASIRALVASIIPKWLDKILQIEVQSFKKRQRRAKD